MAKATRDELVKVRLWTIFTINFYGLEDFYKEYRKHAREMKATRPKEILFEDDLNFMKLTLKY